MDKNRILFIYQAFSKGGTGSVIFNRMQELNRRGISSRALFFQDHGGGMSDFKKQILISSDARILKDYIIGYKPNWALHFDTPGLIPSISEWSPTTKQLYEVHTTYKKNYKPLFRKDIMDRICGVIVPSKYQAGEVSRYSAVRKKPVHIVPNGLRDNFFAHQSESVKVTDPIVGWVGRLEAHKNWLMFLEIAKRLVVKEPKIQIWMIGGHRSTETQHQLFWDTIVRYNLIHQLRWFPEIPAYRMPSMLNTIASSGGCLVSTSKGESFGLAVLEAMACGCPVVVANVGGLSEFVESGINGYVFPKNNISEAVRVILQIIINKPMQLKMGNAAKLKSREFRLQPVVDRFLSVLNSFD